MMYDGKSNAFCARNFISFIVKECFGRSDTLFVEIVLFFSNFAMK